VKRALDRQTDEPLVRNALAFGFQPNRFQQLFRQAQAHGLVLPPHLKMDDLSAREIIAGLRGSRRGKEAAALDSIGAALGSFGLAAFAAVVWLAIGRIGALALVPATAASVAVAAAAWRLRRAL
jgi:hypothetical protein